MGQGSQWETGKCPRLSRSGKVSSLPLSAAKFPQLCKPHGDCECRALTFDPEPPATNPEGHHGVAGDLKTGRGTREHSKPFGLALVNGPLSQRTTCTTISGGPGWMDGWRKGEREG